MQFFLLLLVAISYSCNSQNKTELEVTNEKNNNTIEEAHQIGQYIVSIFEDSKGTLWFGTLGKGVAKYDGKRLQYLTTQDGLVGNGVVSILEDKEGNLWFGTQSGLSKYDGKTFTNFTGKDGLCHNRVSNLLIDSKGNFWVGTWGGVCLFDGNTFTNFSLPNPKIETILNEDTVGWITEILEDKKGNIWFGRDGYAACKYDGNTFECFTKKDGLHSNNVQAIEEDHEGNIWFGTRVAEKDHPDPEKRFGAGGVTKYDGKEFMQFPDMKGLTQNDVYQIYCDDDGKVWVSTIGNGVYKYDGKAFKNFQVKVAEDQSSKAVQSILKDRNENIWLGCTGGLFRLNSSGMVNVTTAGPWE